MKALVIVTLAVLCLGAFASNWAVIVAGSNGYWNYRHQTDGCHAYQILIKNGIAASNIIHMSYDDLVNDPSNPFPGQLFNKPSDGPGVDVYKGCVIDYKGKDTTAKNFLAILKGQKTTTGGKTLKSTSSDNVFIYYTDHGASGLIAMPVGDYLYVDQLTDALDHMWKNKMYKKLTFYLEACESGSMFEGVLPSNTQIYATSAANSVESSWAFYCPPEDSVDGQNIGSCLGDEYSIQWMEDTDAADLKTETLEQQFQIVKSKTKMSHVCQWGDQSFTSLTLNYFQGSANNQEAQLVLDEVASNNKLGRWDVRDVKLLYLMNKHKKQNTLESEADLKEELDWRAYFNYRVGALLNEMNITDEDLQSFTRTTDFDRLRFIVNLFEEKCAKLNDYSLKFVRALATIVEKPFALEVIQSAVEKVCSE